MGVLGHKLTDRIEDADRAKAWYLLRSATRQEKRAEASLIERGFPVYVPRLAELRLDRRTQKRERVERPLFDGYMFSALGPTQTLSDFKVNGVCGPVWFCGRVRPVPMHMIEAMVRDETGGLYDKSLENVVTPLVEGDEVRLLEGPFAGFPGWVVKVGAKKRISLLVSIFGRTSNVTMKCDQVERVERVA